MKGVGEREFGRGNKRTRVELEHIIFKTAKSIIIQVKDVSVVKDVNLIGLS
jgi:hypothetical protein